LRGRGVGQFFFFRSLNPQLSTLNPLQPDRFHGDAHGVFEAVGEDCDLVGFVVAGTVLHDENAVAGVAFVAGGREVGVAFDGPDAALMIDIDAGWGDDIGMLGEEFDLEPRIDGTGRFVGGESCVDAK